MLIIAGLADKPMLLVVTKQKEGLRMPERQLGEGAGLIGRRAKK